VNIGDISYDEKLPWGTLYGIRPAKVAEKLLIKGESVQSVHETLVKTYYASPDRAALCIETAQATLALKETLAPRDIALYLGIPFCPTRCAYCSFVSNSVAKSFALIEPFMDTLMQEIKEMSKIIDELNLRIISVYIGGGTPTSLNESELGSIMTALEQSFDLSSLREYTVEAGRPDTITQEKIEVMKQHGAKRICINPQSMSLDVLTAIGRAHSPEDVYNAVELIQQTNTALNMDIIAGLPNDNLIGFCNTLDTVIGFKPENITVHTLSLKRGSRIVIENTSIPTGEEVGEMLDYSSIRLRESGYAPYYVYRQKYISGGYENTGWSLPRYEGIYNICMMEEICSVFALGGGGVTKIVTPDNRIERVFNAKYPNEYISMTEKMKEKMRSVKRYAISI